MAWLCSPDIDLPVAPLTAADLSVLPMITDIAGSQLHTLVMDWFRAEGSEPAHHHACSNMATRLQLAADGLGIAIAPKSGASRELSVGDLRIVPTVRPLPDLEYLLVHGDFDLAPSAAVVADLARNVLSERLRHLQ
jgi:DNA-binding transcriptional LysR family regulator